MELEKQIKKIVILGPESTGKSTLCAQLAAHYNTMWVREYAREYLTKNGAAYGFEDLWKIAEGQLAVEEGHRTTDHRQQTTDDRGQMIDGRQQTTDDRGKMIDGRQQTIDDSGKMIDGGQQTTGDRGQMIDGRQQTTGDRGQMIDGGQQATGDRGQMIDGRQQTTDDRGQMIDGRQQTTDDGGEMIDGRQQVIDSQQKEAPYEKEMFDMNVQPVTRNPQPVTPKPQTPKPSLLFLDTSLHVIKIWSEFVFNKIDNRILTAIAKRDYDLYLLCDIDLPWVADELREYPDPAVRKKLFHFYKEEMIEQKKPWVIISGSYEERLQNAIKAIDDRLLA